MSARNQGLAGVINIDDARQRPAGERTVERRSDGHRMGDHGNRASELIKKAVIRELRDLTLIHGEPTAADKRSAAERAGVTYRQVCRWWRADLATQLDQAPETGAAQVDDDGNLDRNTLPRYLYRYAETNKFQFTKDEIAFIAQHTTIKKGFAALAARPGARPIIANYGRSTLYDAWANVSPAIRAGAKYGDKVERAGEATYPLTGRDQINETWSIDEYDLKIRADYNGTTVEPKTLIVRERRSGAPLAYIVQPRATDSVDTGVVLGAAGIGFTCIHPRDPDRRLRISGVPRMLVSDQGGAFIGDEGMAAARRLGISGNPTSSHRPQSNGGHEVMHQSLLRHFVDGPGSRRGWKNRAGKRLDHGVLPWETVLEEMDDWWSTLLNSEYTSGDRKGRTRLEVYADDVDAGNVYDGIQLTPADEAAVAVTVAARSYDETRGVCHDNRHWLSPELAAAASPKESITLKQLLDPDVLYAFDRKDRFIGMLLNRADADLEHVHDIHEDRAARVQFVKHDIAEARAEAARTEAAAAQVEVAERRADAAERDPEHDHEDEDEQRHEDVDQQDQELEREDQQEQEPERVHLEVVRPTRRRRTPPADERRAGAEADADADADDAADAVTALFRRNRPQPDEHDQQQQHEDEDEEVEDEGGDDDAH